MPHTEHPCLLISSNTLIGEMVHIFDGEIIMNNRIVTGVLGILAAIGIIFAFVQSQNLTQSQDKLSNLQTAAVSTLSGAGTQAADAQAQAVTAVAQAAATQQAQIIATNNAQASATLNAVVEIEATTGANLKRDQATAQSQTLTAAQQSAATQQAEALST